MKNKLKKYCLSNKDMVKNLDLPSKKYFFVMLSENQLIFSNYDGFNYAFATVLTTEEILKINKKGQWMWSLHALEFLKNRLRIRAESDIANNIITFL